jgi:transposase
LEVVLGVDTHKTFHVAAVIDVLGAPLGNHSFPATAAGYRDLLHWAQSFGPLKRAGVECTSSYGVGLTRHLRGADITVVEVNQPDKSTRRRVGKTDAVDADAAARAVLSGRANAVAKANDGPVEAIRIFRTARSSAIKARTQTINQLKATLLRAAPELRESLAGLNNPRLFRACAALEAESGNHPGAAAVYTIRLLARRIINLTEEIDDLQRRIGDLIAAHRPAMLQRQGVGPDTAAALLIAAGDNPRRLTSEASFAALCGASPVEASSGKTQRRRLNRGGDRQANCALHTIVLSRLRWDTATREYVNRRITEGKTRREAIRCLKRYVARELYTLIITPGSAT